MPMMMAMRKPGLAVRAGRRKSRSVEGSGLLRDSALIRLSVWRVLRGALRRRFHSRRFHRYR